MTIHVLIVDDSALIRQLLSQIIEQEPEFTLAGAAPDAYAAKRLVIEQHPDVITLDIEMPKVDGLRFLEVLMNARPTPVLMISTLTESGAEATIRSLELGAIDFMPKPKLDVASGIEAYRQLIVEKIKLAAKAKVRRYRNVSSRPMPMHYSGTEKIIAIGASTGGTEAIKEITDALPANAPAVVITQHMPPGYTSTYAKRLNASSALTIIEAKGGERVLPGHGYLAPGDRHMEIIRSGADYRIRLHQEARVSGHRPSVDVMFHSLVKSAGKNVVACVLTGMGKDGASGLLKLRQQGAFTLCQNEQTSVVFGMPKAAIELGGACDVLPLENIAARVIRELEALQASTRM